VVFVLGVGGVVSSLPTRVAARDPAVELDSEVYSGQSHGEWSCGPRGVARYGGVGVRAKISERPSDAEKGAGFRATVGASAEYEVVDECCSRLDDRPMVGLGGTVGYREAVGGISLGLLGYQGYDSWTSNGPDWSSFPAFEIVVGRERGFHWPLGFGAPLVSTYRRPALAYTGPSFTTRTLRLDALAGFYRSGPASLATIQFRGDMTLGFRLSEGLWVGPHVSLAAEGEPVDGEAGLNVAFSP
jgi:hypothetical protein